MRIYMQLKDLENINALERWIAFFLLYNVLAVNFFAVLKCSNHTSHRLYHPARTIFKQTIIDVIFTVV